MSVLVQNMTTGEVIDSYREDHVVPPASVMKLLTTAAALETLGPGFRFPTILEYNGTIENGVLHGDLYIRGGCDPSLGWKGRTAFLDKWVKALQAAGINRIEGAVIADMTMLDGEAQNPNWLCEDAGNYYAPGIFALNYYGNTMNIVLQSGEPGSIAKVIKTEPAVEDVYFINHIRCDKITYDGAFVSGLPYSLIVALISFAGTPPDLLSPYFLKRFSYKQIMIFFQLSRAVGNAIIAAAMWFCGDNLVLCGTICIVVLIFMEMTSTVPKTAGHDMNVRIGDYQMYLTGERLESYSGIFGWFTGPITNFVGMIIPLLLLKYGFNSNWDVLFVDASRRNIIVIPLIVDAIGFFLMTIPYLFWDYDSKKQNMVMEVLKRRAEVTSKQAEAEGISTDGSYLG